MGQFRLEARADRERSSQHQDRFVPHSGGFNFRLFSDNNSKYLNKLLLNYVAIGWHTPCNGAVSCAFVLLRTLSTQSHQPAAIGRGRYPRSCGRHNRM